MTKTVQKTKQSRKPDTISRIAAKQALLAITPELQAVPRDALTIVRTNVQRASAIAHSVARRDLQPSRRERLDETGKAARLPPDLIERVMQYAMATWYARRTQLRLNASRSNATVPVHVVREAQEVRARMLRLTEYYFDTDPKLATTLATIRSGTGLNDLANDLEDLAELYENPQVFARISKDTMHYREDDPVKALELAQAVFAGMGLAEDSEQAQAADRTQRAWTLLSGAYEELRTLGQFTFRHEEDVSLTYPSLISASRSSSGSSSRDEEPEEDDLEPEPEEPDAVPPAPTPPAPTPPTSTSPTVTTTAPREPSSE